MIEIAFDKSFKRAFKKKVKGKPELEEKFWKILLMILLMSRCVLTS
jgi:mRNA-degrading endonuclease YafQ of YafQ-DinJ toxin-antitoxin module